MSAVKYDLVVIGSGPAGQRAAVAAAKIGKRVAVVEAREVVGGVCINTGTIPSKTMREAVLHLSGYNYRSIYGVNYRVKEKITMADLAFRVQAVIKTEVDVTEAQLSRNGIDVVHGIARFIDPHHVRVEGAQADTTIEADNIIIAVGTKPAASDKVPVNGKSIVNSDQILGLEALPRSLIVVLAVIRKRCPRAGAANTTVGCRIEDEGIVGGVGQCGKVSAGPASAFLCGGGNRKLARRIVQAGVVFVVGDEEEQLVPRMRDTAADGS